MDSFFIGQKGLLIWPIIYFLFFSFLFSTGWCPPPWYKIPYQALFKSFFLSVPTFQTEEKFFIKPFLSLLFFLTAPTIKNEESLFIPTIIIFFITFLWKICQSQNPYSLFSSCTYTWPNWPVTSSLFEEKMRH